MASAFRALLALRPLAGLVLAGAVLASAVVPARPAHAADAPAPHAVVLMYHRFGEDQYPSTSIRLAQFEAHLAELRKEHYAVLPVPAIVDAIRDGKSLPERTVGITIDDAYLSVYTEAWPRLKEAGFPFTVFVATDAVDEGYGGIMSWAQLRELKDSGLVTIGNHTASHLHMADHAPEALRRELRHANQRLHAELGVRPDLFAYTYGEYGLEVMSVVEEEGFVAAFGQHSGAIGPGTPLLELPRFALNEHYGAPDRFTLAINALPLPVRDREPSDMLLTSADNPPRLAFTVGEAAGSLERLTCYASGQGRLKLQHAEGRRVAVQPPQAFPPGRSRINCTLPGPEGRWRWYGVQFYRPGT